MLNESKEVQILIKNMKENGKPNTKLPGLKRMKCDPAGSRGEPLAMVHTIVRPAAVIAQDAVSTAEPDAGTSKPCGEPAPEK